MQRLMPARILPPTETARGASIATKKSSATAKDVKGRRGGVEVARLKDTATASIKEGVKASATKANAASQADVILTAISSQSSCSKLTIAALLSHLEVSNDVLRLPGLGLGEKGKLGATGSAQPVRQPLKTKEIPSEPSFSAERIHFAKQVVNATITSLNEVLSAGWKSSTPTTLVLEVASARPASTSSRASSTVSARKTELSRNASATRAPSPSSRTEGNINAIFGCARIAIHYLCEAQKGSHLKAGKELELQNIMSSLVRKMISMDLVSFLTVIYAQESSLKSSLTSEIGANGLSRDRVAA